MYTTIPPFVTLSGPPTSSEAPAHASIAATEQPSQEASAVVDAMLDAEQAIEQRLRGRVDDPVYRDLVLGRLRGLEPRAADSAALSIDEGTRPSMALAVHLGQLIPRLVLDADPYEAESDAALHQSMVDTLTAWGSGLDDLLFPGIRVFNVETARGLAELYGAPPPADSGDVTALGYVATAAALVTAANAGAKALGFDVEKLVRDGVDSFLGLFGIGTCSKKNKNKYRKMVAEADHAELIEWLGRKRVGGATGACNKYAMALAIRRAKTEGDALERQQSAGQSKRKTPSTPPPKKRSATRTPARSTPAPAVVLAAALADGAAWSEMSSADRRAAYARAIAVLGRSRTPEWDRLMALPWAERREEFARLESGGAERRVRSATKAIDAPPMQSASMNPLIVGAVLAAVAGGIYIVHRHNSAPAP